MSRPPRTERTAAPELQAPRLATAWAALVYAMATMLLAYPALGGAFLAPLHSDQFIAGYAFREFAAATLKAGEGFPQWNPYLFGGLPYMAAMHGDIFYPTFLLRMLLPTDVAMTWGFVIHLFLAGLFTFCFLRAYGVGFYGSLVGGLAYMLSGPIAGYASPGHDGKLFVSTLLPLTLWMLVRGVRDNRPWSWGVLAVAIGLAVLSPHPQLLQYMLLVSGAFALFLAMSPGADGTKLPGKVVLARLGRALGAVLVGFAIGAIQYASVLGYIDWSPRAGGTGYAHAVSYSMPIEELLNTVVPEFSGILDAYWGRNGIHFHSEYAGVVVLVLAGAGMFFAAYRTGFRRFWLVTLVVSLLWALGGYTPLYRIIYELVPGTKFFRAPSTMMYVTMFSVAVFAALGTERVLAAAASLTRKFYIGWAAAVVVIGLFIAGGLTGAVARDVGAEMADTRPQYQQYQREQVVDSWVQRAESNQPAAIIGSMRSIAFALATLGLLLAAARGKVSPRATALLLTALVVVDLWSIERRYWIFAPRASDVYRSDPAIDYLKSAAEPGRVITWDIINAAQDRDPAFTDQMMSHRVRLVGGYHGNELGRYRTLMEQAGFFTNGLGSAQFWRHENAQYLYTTVPDSMMAQVALQLQLAGVPGKLVGPVQNARGSTVYLYRLPGNNPAAWVATVMVKGADDQALATVLDPRFDPTRAAIIDTASAIRAATPTTAPAPASVKASVTRFDPGAIDVQLDGSAPEGAALVVSENFYPGWRATADGRDAQVARANYNLIGVALPAGARQIQLRFSDPAYATGKVITLVALLLAVAAIVAGVILGRRHPAFATN